MYNPTLRLLTILEILQSRGEVSGQELAQKLEVEERSIRRYVMMLRDIGIPIEGERGRHGGYSLRPGFRLPPMMFNADEITAVMMGLMLMRELGSASSLAVESAAAKIERVLPIELRHYPDSLRSSILLDHVQIKANSINSDFLLTFSMAIYENRCLQIEYITTQGETSQRLIAPYGLVLYARKWYIPAYCYLREDMRVFRLDRVRAVAPSDQHFTKPADFDAKKLVYGSLSNQIGTYAFKVLFDAPLSIVQEYVPADWAILEGLDEKTLMRCYSDDPHWLARYLVRIELPFTVLETDELKSAMRALARDIMASIED
jgi:predicted DNA-binding transcriptional regulator YafY